MRNLTLFVLVSIFLISGCSKPVQQAEKIFPVKIMALKPQTIQSTIKTSGLADSKSHSIIGSPVEGSVYSLNVVEGQHVGAGEILCSIMPLDQQNMLGQVKADYEQAKREFENSSPEDSDMKQKTFAEAEENLASAKKLYKPFPVASPISGMVISKNIEPGNNVSLKQQLMEIANIDKMIVKTAVSEEYLGHIYQGQKVRVTINAFPENTLDGTITVITPKVRLDTGTSDIEISISGSKGVRPGMTAEIEIVVARKENVIVIPQDALIIKPDGGIYVFIAETNSARMIKISTGLESNTDVEVLSGLKNGDSLIVMGQDNLKDGSKIKLPETQNNPVKRTEKQK